MKLTTRLHECLAEGRVAVGTFAALNSPEAVELLANGTELDFMGTDLQHGGISGRDSAHLIRALQAADPRVTPLVRLPNHEKYWIEQSLDAGYVGLIAPITESADQAEALVQRAYFPPVGARSMAGSIRASLYEDYFDTINDRLLLLPQVESAPGLAHVDEIVGVEGVSGVLLGPGDLSLSCGWAGEDLWSHPPFLEAAERVAAACRSRDRHAAILTGGNGIYAARDMGYNIIGIGSDAVHVRIGMTEDVRDRLARLRSGQS